VLSNSGSYLIKICTLEIFRNRKIHCDLVTEIMLHCVAGSQCRSSRISGLTFSLVYPYKQKDLFTCALYTLQLSSKMSETHRTAVSAPTAA
jgi:hypothetical protein